MKFIIIILLAAVVLTLLRKGKNKGQNDNSEKKTIKNSSAKKENKRNDTKVSSATEDGAIQIISGELDGDDELVALIDLDTLGTPDSHNDAEFILHAYYQYDRATRTKEHIYEKMFLGVTYKKAVFALFNPKKKYKSQYTPPLFNNRTILPPVNFKQKESVAVLPYPLLIAVDYYVDMNLEELINELYSAIKNESELYIESDKVFVLAASLYVEPYGEKDNVFMAFNNSFTNIYKGKEYSPDAEENIIKLVNGFLDAQERTDEMHFLVSKIFGKNVGSQGDVSHESVYSAKNSQLLRKNMKTFCEKQNEVWEDEMLDTAKSKLIDAVSYAFMDKIEEVNEGGTL